MFTTHHEDPATLFDVPYFIVDAVKRAVTRTCHVVNAAYLLIGEKEAVVTTMPMRSLIMNMGLTFLLVVF